MSRISSHTTQMSDISREDESMSQIWDDAPHPLAELVGFLDTQGDTRELDLGNPDDVRDYIARKKQCAQVAELARLDDLHVTLLDSGFDEDDLESVRNMMDDISRDLPGASGLLLAERRSRGLRKALDSGLLTPDSFMFKSLVRTHVRLSQ